MKITTYAELDAVKRQKILTAAHAAELEVFGRQHCRSFAKLRQCAEHHPDSFFLAVDRGRLVGQIDLWPLTQLSYASIKGGARAEESLSPSDISDRESRFWYIGVFVVGDAYRRNVLADAGTSLPIARLLIQAVASYLSEIEAVFPISLFVVGSSVAGRKVAAHWGMGRFIPKNQRSLPSLADERPRYFRSFDTRSELNELIYWRTPTSRNEI